MAGYTISDKLMAIAVEERGTPHPWPVIPAGRAALVVIDMQKYFMAPGSQAEAESGREIVPPINRLAAAMRERGGRVVWVQTTTTDTRRALDVRPEDTNIVKTLYSAFAPGSSDLPARLKSEGIEYVLIAGIYTNVCCQASAEGAMMLNFRTIMVSDCNASSSQEAHTAALDNFFQYFGDVLNTDEVIARLESKRATAAA